METVKEKLAKLIDESKSYANHQCFHTQNVCVECPFSKESNCKKFYQAEYLIQNGVTIQEWVSVDERLPEKTGKYIVCTAKNAVYCAKYYANGKHFGTEMNTHITHWMPLPEPPKGVQ
jgi:hypothetical protein